MIPDPGVRQLDATIRKIVSGLRMNAAEKAPPPSREITVSALEKTLPEGGMLKPGDRLSGLVLPGRRDDKLLIDFGKFRGKADVNFPVSPKDVLNVKITEVGSRLIKMVLDAPERSTMAGATGRAAPGVVVSENALKEFISTIAQTLKNNPGFPAGARASGEAASLLATIKGHFEPLSMEDAAPGLSRQLQSRIGNAGLFFEKRLESVLEKLAESGVKGPVGKLLQLPEIKHIIENDLKPVHSRARAGIGDLAGAKGAAASEGGSWGRIRASLTSLLSDIQTRQASLTSKGAAASAGRSAAEARASAPGSGVEPSRPHTLISKLIRDISTHLKTSGEAAPKSMETALAKLVEAEKVLSTAPRPAPSRPAAIGETRVAPPLADPPEAGKTPSPRGTRLDFQPAFEKAAPGARGKSLFQTTPEIEAPRIQGKQPAFQASQIPPSVHSRGAPASTPAPPGGADFGPSVGGVGGSGVSAGEADGRVTGPGGSVGAAGKGAGASSGGSGAAIAGAGVSGGAAARAGASSGASAGAAGPGGSVGAGGTGGGVVGSGGVGGGSVEGPGGSGGSPGGSGGGVGGSGGSPGGSVGGVGGSAGGVGGGVGGVGGGVGPAVGGVGGDVGGAAVSGFGGGGGAADGGAGNPLIGSDARRSGEEVLERIVIQQRPGAEPGGAAPAPLTRALEESIVDPKTEKETIAAQRRGASPSPESQEEPASKARPRMILTEGFNRLLGRVLNNLKPELQALERYFETVDERAEFESMAGRKGIRNTVSELIRVIDQQQTAEPREQAPDPMQVISYDLLLKETDQKARLKIFYRKKKKENQNKDHRASLQLKMNKIGDIRTDFILAGKKLDITFHVSSAEVKRKIEEHSHEVRGRLTELVEELSMEVKVAEKKPRTGADAGPSDFGENRIVDLKV